MLNPLHYLRNKTRRTGVALCVSRHLFLAVVLFILSACNGEIAQEGASIRMALASLPTSLDPRYATDAVSTRVNRLLYQSLTDFNEKAEVIPQLATWVQLGPQHYRFRLIKQAPGDLPDHQIGLADVKATYDSILVPESASPHRGSIQHIREIIILDQETIDFHLTRPDGLFPGNLTIGILPAALIAKGHDFNLRPMGTGPFAFHSRPNPNQLNLRRKKDNLELQLMRVSDPTMRALMLVNQEADLLQNDLPPETLDYLSGQEDIRIGRVAGANFSYIGFNLSDAVISDQRIREAIAHAIDRDSIIDYLFNGHARKAESILPPEHWAGTGRLMEIKFDPDRSRALLESAGYSIERPVKISYKTSSDPFRLRLATILQSQLKEVGIDIRIQSYDWGTFFGDVKAGNFQMYSLTWVGIYSPDIFRYVFHSDSIPPNGANRGRYINDQTDALIDQAESETDPLRQARHYQRIQSQTHADLVYVPLWYEDNQVASRRHIVDYRPGKDGNYDQLRQIRKML